MRLLVCGGRTFGDVPLAYRVLDRIHKKCLLTTVIEGDAPGADRIAGRWARNNKIADLKFKADWDNYGKAAGAIRNQQMLDEGKPDAVLAFPGGRGTQNMCDKALAAGVKVLKVNMVGRSWEMVPYLGKAKPTSTAAEAALAVEAARRKEADDG
jgi:hypothetical protein